MSNSPRAQKLNQSPKQSQTVHFNIDQNTFITIDKESGNQFVSHKNGHPITVFKPNITGFNYNLRKTASQNNRHSFDSVPFPQHKTIDNYNQKKTDRQHRFLKPIKKNINLVPPTQIRHFFHNQRQKSESLQKQQLFSAQMSKYTILLREKSRQNHSPKKNVVEGCEQIKDAMDSMVVTMKDFKKTDFTDLFFKRKKQFVQRKQLNQQFTLKKYVQKQKAIFLKFHPQMQVKTKEREQAFKERRRNMLKLEKLFLYQADKSTSKIYNNY